MIVATHDHAQPPYRVVEDRDGVWNLGLEFPDVTDLVGLVGESTPGVRPGALEYWRLGWPPLRKYGAGWETVDDAVHGFWQPARAGFSREGVRFEARFEPLDGTEVQGWSGEPCPYRRSLKFRVRGSGSGALGSLRPLFRNPLEPARYLLEVGIGAEPPATVEVSLTQAVFGDGSIRASFPAGEAVAIPVFRAVGAMDAPGNRPVATFSWLAARGTRGCAVALDDVDRSGGVWVPDHGLLVRPVGTASAPAEPARAFISRITSPGMRTVEQVRSAGSYTIDDARAAMPPLVPALHRRTVVLGCEANRGEFGVRHDGRIVLDKASLKLRPCDQDALSWPAPSMTLECAVGERGPDRGVEPQQAFGDARVPVLRSVTEQDGVESSLECLATLLDPELGDTEQKRGTEPSFLLLRWLLTNRTRAARTVRSWVLLASGEALVYRDRELLAYGEMTSVVGISYARKFYRDPKVRLACADDGWELAAAVDPESPTGTSPALFRETAVAAGAVASAELILPFESWWEQGSSRSWALGYQTERERVSRFWTGRSEALAKLTTADHRLDSFLRAVPWHVLVTADKEPRTGRWHVGAATWYYGDFPNEAAVQSRWLDMMGAHEVAGRILQPVIDGQSSRTPPGAYTSPEGAFHLSGTFNMGAYGLDLGWSAWALAEHYLFCRDREWLAENAAGLIAAAQFVERERHANPADRGLLPPGAVEDVQEWRRWFEVNILCWAGLRFTVEALKDLDDPRASQIAEQARDYRADIDAAIREAVARSVVVRLGDGTWVPHVPSHDQSRFPDAGWARECLESPLARGVTVGFWEPDDPLVDWLVNDFEDNRYAPPTTDLRRSDPPGVDAERVGVGITKQPMLIDLPIVHLLRGDVAAAHRGMFNAYAATAYEDVSCLAEWIPEFGRGAGPLYKTPDECGFLAWIRSLIVMDTFEGLRIGWGAPMPWKGSAVSFDRLATFHGPVSGSIRDVAGRREIRLELSERAMGKALEFRTPEGIALVRPRERTVTLSLETSGGS